MASAVHSKVPQLAQPLLENISMQFKYPAWSAQQRPTSAKQQLVMQWRLPLQQVQQLFAGCKEPLPPLPDLCQLCYGDVHTWQGQDFKLRLGIYRSSQTEPGINLKASLFLAGVPDSCVRTVSFSLAVQTAAASSTPNNRKQQPAVASVSCTLNAKGRNSFGWVDVVTGVQPITWAAAAAKLRKEGLVHSDGCLYIKGVVTRIH